MQISDIYKQYSIPSILQKHMYTVAALGARIADAAVDTDHNIDKDLIVQGLLVHDMGNIVKFDLTGNSFFTHDELPKWRTIQALFIERYGADDHEATINILKELGVRQDVQKLIAYTVGTDVAFPMLKNDSNFGIMFYADFRVGPYGVLSLDERIDELLVRYKDRTSHYWSDAHRAERMRIRMKDYEKELSEKVSMDVGALRSEDITSSLQRLSSYPVDLDPKP